MRLHRASIVVSVVPLWLNFAPLSRTEILRHSH